METTEAMKEFSTNRCADPSANNKWALCLASMSDDAEALKKLLEEEGEDPSANGNLAIRLASENGCTATIKMLLMDLRVDLEDTGIDDKSNSGFHRTSEKRRAEVLRKMFFKRCHNGYCYKCNQIHRERK